MKTERPREIVNAGFDLTPFVRTRRRPAEGLGRYRLDTSDAQMGEWQPHRPYFYQRYL
jgi:hypothetical protein